MRLGFEQFIRVNGARMIETFGFRVFSGLPGAQPRVEEAPRIQNHVFIRVDGAHMIETVVLLHIFGAPRAQHLEFLRAFDVPGTWESVERLGTAWHVLARAGTCWHVLGRFCTIQGRAPYSLRSP